MSDNAENKEPATRQESLPELLGQLARSSAAVFRDEIELVIQRIREKTRAVRIGIILLSAGAIIIFAAFLSFCASLIIGLTAFLSPTVAALVTGVALALVGIVIAFIGYRQLKK